MVSVVSCVLNSKNTYKLLFSDGRILFLPASIVSEENLVSGTIIDKNLSRLIDLFSDCKKDYLYALRILKRFKYSKYSLKRKLLQRNVNPENIEIIIEQLSDKGLINDNEYATNLINGYVLKNKGRKYIEEVFKQKQLSFSVLDNYYEDKNEPYSINLVINMLVKKSTNKSKTALKESIYSKLLRDGFIQEGIIPILDTNQALRDYNELSSLRSEYEKLLRRKYNSEEIRRRLLKKKYRKSNIKNIMEE